MTGDRFSPVWAPSISLSASTMWRNSPSPVMKWATIPRIASELGELQRSQLIWIRVVDLLSDALILAFWASYWRTTQSRTVLWLPGSHVSISLFIEKRTLDCGSVGNNISNRGLAIFLAIQYGQNGQCYCNIHQNSQYNIGISKSWQYNRRLSNIVPHTALISISAQMAPLACQQSAGQAYWY